MPLSDFGGDWARYEDAIYAAYLDTVAHAGLTLFGLPVRVRFIPTTKKKGYGFWHLISEAPTQDNRNEDDRTPDLARCERVRWVAWCIAHAEAEACSTKANSWYTYSRRGAWRTDCCRSLGSHQRSLGSVLRRSRAIDCCPYRCRHGAQHGPPGSCVSGAEPRTV